MKYKGRFGDYGGFYVPEVLIPVLEELEQAFYRFYEDKQFVVECKYGNQVPDEAAFPLDGGILPKPAHRISQSSPHRRSTLGGAIEPRSAVPTLASAQ